jgi:hypothetical protein
MPDLDNRSRFYLIDGNAEWILLGTKRTPKIKTRMQIHANGTLLQDDYHELELNVLETDSTRSQYNLQSIANYEIWNNATPDKVPHVT